MKNPRLRPAPSYYPRNITSGQSCDVPDRLAELASFDSSKLRAVINYPGTQKTVRVRAEMFLKRRGIDANKSGG
jgi:hypothetical protein